MSLTGVIHVLTIFVLARGRWRVKEANSMNCHQKTSLKSLIDFKYLNFSNFSSPAEVKYGKVWAFLVVFPGSFEKIAA